MNSLSLNQIAYNLQNAIEGNRPAPYEYISLDQVKFIIKYYRSLYIRRDAQKNGNRLELFEQDLGLLSTEQVNSSENDTTLSTHFLRRTSKKIPTPIRLKRKPGLTYIATVGKFNEPFPLVNSARSYYKQYDKYTPKDKYAIYQNGYVYLENAVATDKLNVRGVFEDPEQVFEFLRTNGSELYDENEPFPISQDMIESITKNIIQGEITMFQQPANSTPNSEAK